MLGATPYAFGPYPSHALSCCEVCRSAPRIALADVSFWSRVQPPKAAAVGRDAGALTASHPYVAGKHTILAVASDTADAASDFRSALSLRHGAAHLDKIGFKGALSASLRTETRSPILDRALLSVESSLANFANDGLPSATFGGDYSCRFSGSETLARTKSRWLGGADGGRPPLKRLGTLFASEGQFPTFLSVYDDPASLGFAKALGTAKTDLATFCFGRAMERRRSIKRRRAPFASGGDFRNGCWHVKLFQRSSGEVGGHRGQPDWCNTYTNLTNPAIPNQAANVRICIPRVAEGVTTRPCGNNNRPTSARRHSIGEDIVWATASRLAQAVEGGHKQATGNIPTFMRYSGYDVLNISPSDVLTAAQYPIAQAACAVTISGLEQIQNNGAEKVIDLLDSRIDNAEITMRNNISNDCYSNGKSFTSYALAA